MRFRTVVSTVTFLSLSSEEKGWCHSFSFGKRVSRSCKPLWRFESYRGAPNRRMTCHSQKTLNKSTYNWNKRTVTVHSYTRKPPKPVAPTPTGRVTERSRRDNLSGHVSPNGGEKRGSLVVVETTSTVKVRELNIVLKFCTSICFTL